MTVKRKLIERILSGQSDQDIEFEELTNLLRTLGFAERVRGSHRVFRRAGIREHVNLQRDGANAKSYQVRQVRNLILKYRLGI